MPKYLMSQKGCSRAPIHETFVPLSCLNGKSSAEIKKIVLERQQVYSTENNAEDVYFKPRGRNTRDNWVIHMIPSKNSIEAEEEIEIETEPEDKAEKAIKFVRSRWLDGIGLENGDNYDGDNGNEREEEECQCHCHSNSNYLGACNKVDAIKGHLANGSAPSSRSSNQDDDDDEDGAKFLKPPSAPNLTFEMIEKVQEALKGPPGAVVVSGFDQHVTVMELTALFTEMEWLDDTIMNFYLGLIQERSRSHPKKVFAFPCFFYGLYSNRKNGRGLESNERGFKDVEEITKDVNIFEKDLVFFPVCLSNHWRLIVFSLPRLIFKCYNSLVSNNSTGCTDMIILETIAEYLKSEWEKKNMTGHIEDEDWDVGVALARERPKQRNGNDCGVFVLQFAEYLSRSEDFDFGQCHIPYFRKRMAYEVLTKKLLLLT